MDPVLIDLMKDTGVTFSKSDFGSFKSQGRSLSFGELMKEPGVTFSSESERGGFQQGLSSRSLSFHLPPELLRGTPLTVALSGFCQHWGGLEQPGERKLFSLSKEVNQIDVFLSHDWATSRWMKLITLLLFFNSKAAALAAILWSVILGVLKLHLPELRGNHWGFSSYLVFLIVLLFWQRIRASFRSPTVFLDKLCIHQEDEELKMKGILGLGAFVHRSERLLILWSKRTFSRLWCSYEIGCFLNRSRPLEQLEVLPVTAAALIFLQAFLWHALILCFGLSVDMTAPDLLTPKTVISAATTVVVVALLHLPIMNYLAMSLMQDVEQLPQQMHDFRIQNSHCFCCSNAHKHPLTGEQMICDRELVYESLRSIYAKNEEDPLDTFNRQVREHMGPRIQQRVHRDLPMRYMWSMVWVSNFAILSEAIYILATGPKTRLVGVEYAVWFIRLVLTWAQPCQAMVFAFLFSKQLWKLRAISCFRDRPMVLSIFLTPIQGMAVGIVWAGPILATFLSDDTDLLPILFFGLTLPMNILLHYC